ncbi:sulfotransferase family 2 domain-containing protein [Marinimicrobium sp. C2-29]|uniref:sulfotransferase family 2 domain-containing protein n=1 Tax=Marinimicrobium sp. C2-29 TaxID=3139825 RepID=UPI0031395A10
MNILRYASDTNSPLQSNQRHQFAQSHALSLYRSRAIYSFIPKNACSTLRYSLAIHNGCLERGGDINWIHANNGTFRTDLAAAITAEYTFVVLRCPLRRLASVFLDKFVGKDGPAWLFYEMTGRAVSLDDVTFRYFVESLSSNNVLGGEIHWKPQVDFLLYKEYTDVFSVERFSEAVNILNEKLNFEVHDARPLTRHGLDQYTSITEGTWADVPIKELYQLKVNGQIPAPECMYSARLYKSVCSIYSQDVELYKKWCNSDCMLKV